MTSKAGKLKTAEVNHRIAEPRLLRELVQAAEYALEHANTQMQ